jgi:DNA repair exonuclease SbcCD ATPase subunit
MNGVGKTTVFDAFTWLLFGKDSLDRKDYGIKPVENGKPLPRTNVAVAGVLTVNGTEIVLRRVLVEEWVKPRGQVEEVFKGNKHELFWNDVPLKVSEYQKRVNDIIDESVFKMITNPIFFAGMDWKLQREQLFKIAGSVSDAEIGIKEPDFAALLDRISGKSFAEYKQEIAYKKKRLNGELKEIQPKINQTRKLMPQQSDFDSIEAEISDLESQIADIDRAIADKNEAVQQQFEIVRQKQDELNSLRQRQQTLLHEARMAAQEATFKANEKRRELEHTIQKNESEIRSLESRNNSLIQEVSGLKASLMDAEAVLKSKRTKWQEENAKEYNASSEVCPYCQQQLPDDMKDNLRELFEEGKANVLDAIAREGKQVAENVARLNELFEKQSLALTSLEVQISTQRLSLASLKRQLESMPTTPEAEKLNPPAECAEITLQMIELQKTMHDVEPANTTVLQQRKQALLKRLDAAKSVLRNRELISEYTSEIGRLESEGRIIAQQIADVEHEEYIMQQFTKAKIEECDRRINDLFKHVSFKLFDYTIDGNEVETCIALVGENKVPFPHANTAGQINAGIDIINTLTGFYKTSAPIFVDRRESVNDLIESKSQIISLVVSNDKELIIK